MNPSTAIDDFEFETMPGAAMPGPVPDSTKPLKTAAPPTGNGNGRRKLRRGEAEADSLPTTLITGLEIIGYKRIRAVKFQLNRDGITVIGGLNGSGKTSNLEAVIAAFQGGKAIPDVPVHLGEPKAEIIAHLESSDGRRFQVKRSIQPDRSTELVVSREDGTAVERPAEFLKSMVGTLWYDPVAFIRQSPKEQAETLRKLNGLDFTELEKERADLYEQRTNIGRDRDREKGHAEKMMLHADVPTLEVTADSILADLDEAVKSNGEIAAKQTRLQQGYAHREMLGGRKQAAELNIEAVDRQIADLQTKRDKLSGELGEANSKIAEFAVKLAGFEEAVSHLEAIDTSSISAKLSAIEETNHKVRENAERRAAYDRFEAHVADFALYTSHIDALDQDKAEQLAAADMPVPGLAFSPDGLQVLYDDLPLSAASGAEQMRVSVAMAMKMSGGLKVCLVDAGEQLDLTQLHLLDSIVRDMGGQVLMTRVSEGEECDIHIVDGAIREAAAA